VGEDARLEAATALWWKAHRLSDAGAHHEALPLWEELAHFGDPRVVRTGRTGQAFTLVEMGRYRDAQRVYAVLAAERMRRGWSQWLVGWLLVIVLAASGKLRFRGLLARLHSRLRAKYEPIELDSRASAEERDGPSRDH